MKTIWKSNKVSKRKFKLNLTTKNSKEFFRFVTKVKGTTNPVTKCGDISVEDFNFITAVDTSDTHHWKRQQAEQPQSIFLRPVIDAEVTQHISKSKNKKSVGMDCTEMAVFKKAFQIVSPYLKTAFNKCIHAGVIPQSMKSAQLIPIFKAGESILPSNERPIFVLGTLSKLFEKVLHKRLRNYLEKTAILSKKQYGFRKKKDSAQAATSLLKQIEANWRSKVKTNSVFG